MIKYQLFYSSIPLNDLPVTHHFVLCTLAAIPIKKSASLIIKDTLGNVQNIKLSEAPTRKIYFAEIVRQCLIEDNQKAMIGFFMQSLVKGLKKPDRIYFSERLWTEPIEHLCKTLPHLKWQKAGSDTIVYYQPLLPLPKKPTPFPF